MNISKKSMILTSIILMFLLIVIYNLKINYFTNDLASNEIDTSIKYESNATVVYNIVDDYKADGTDEIDDREAIQNALNNAKNSNGIIEVYIPSGTYYISSTLYIYSNTILTLDENATIINSKGTVGMLKAIHLDDSGNTCSSSECTHGEYSQWQNIIIQGGTWNFNHNGTNNPDGFILEHGQNLTIQNTTIENYSGHALNISASKDIVIDSVTFKNQISSEPNKSDNTNETIHLDSATNSGEPNRYPEDGTPVKNVTIKNSTFENVLCGIGSHTAYTDDTNFGDEIIIINNKFNNVKRFAINLFAHKNVEIYGNTAIGADGSYAFVQTYYAEANIHDNDVSNFEATIIKNQNSNNNYELTLDDESANNMINMYYIVNYDANGGTGTMESNEFTYGVYTNFAKNTFIRKGYKFIGWNAYRNQTGSSGWHVTNVGFKSLEEIEEKGYTLTLFSDEHSVSVLCNQHRAEVTLYAQWTPIKNISITTKPNKLNYIQNDEEIDLSGGVLTATYEDGSTETINLNDSSVNVTNFDNSKIGTNTLKIEYNGKSTTLDVEIIEDEKEDDDIYDVILFWGQSNMVGDNRNASVDTRFDYTDTNSVDEFSKKTGIDVDILKNNSALNYVKVSQTPKTAYEYTLDGLVEISDQTKNLGEYITYDSTSNSLVKSDSDNCTGCKSSGINMIPKFVQTYYELTGHKVVVVFSAKSEISIEQITPNYGENYYETMITKYKDAIAYLNDNGYTIGNKLYVVAQGEDDIELEVTEESYYNNFMLIHNSLKKDLGITKGAIVYTASSIGTEDEQIYQNIQTVHSAQKKLVEENDDIILGSDYPYKHYVPSELLYNSDEFITNYYLDENNNKLDYETAFTNASYSVQYPDNTLHFTSASLSQIGKEVATAFVKSKQIVNIELSTLPTKLSYVQNIEELDLTGGIITVTYDDLSKDKIKITNENIKVISFDNSNLGTTDVTIEYLEKELTFSVEIISDGSETFNVPDTSKTISILIITGVTLIMVGILVIIFK